MAKKIDRILTKNENFIADKVEEMMDAGEDYTQLMSLATIYAYSKQQKKSIEEYLSLNHDS